MNKEDFLFPNGDVDPFKLEEFLLSLGISNPITSYPGCSDGDCCPQSFNFSFNVYLNENN